MKSTFDVFSVRELRTRTGDLMRDAEEGRLAVITKRGRPAALCIPFDDLLLRHGAYRTLAIILAREGLLSIGKASTLAGLEPMEFQALVAGEGIALPDSPTDDSEQDMRKFQP